MKLRYNYFIIPLLVLITGSAASYFAQSGVTWYKTLNLPEWTPSSSVIVSVWTIIFVLSGISILIVWNRYSKQKHFGLIIGLFILNGIINVGWNIIFFSNQQIGLAFFQALLLTINVILLVVLIWRFCPLAATCLLPYSIWVIFFTLLTYYVWMLN